MSKRVRQQSTPLDPVAPGQLEIAKLAHRAPPEASSQAGAQESRAAVVRVSVWLDRARLDVADDPMMFRLKMALIQGLRRRFRYSVIEIDDVAPGEHCEGGMRVETDPPGTDTEARAAAVVRRVLRWRRWAA
jgi:hypothetical protein